MRVNNKHTNTCAFVLVLKVHNITETVCIWIHACMAVTAKQYSDKKNVS